MKKIILFISILLLPIFIYAKEYELQDINLKLSIKDDYMVLTRDNLKDNNDLKKLNITKEYMEELMNKNNIYFDIIKNDISYEILVIIPQTVLKFNNMANANDKLLNDMKTELAKKTGAKVSDIYKAKHNFILVDYYDANTGYYIVNYYTVVNAKGYNFQLQKKSAITEEEKASLKELIDTVEIKTLDEYKEETSEMQEKIDKYENNKDGYNYKNIIYGAIIGAITGLGYYFINLFIKKKKSSI